MEIPDVIVVNKADHPMTDTMVREVRGVLALSHDPEGWKVPILRTEAARGEGVEELAEKIDEHRAFIEEAGTLGERRARNLRSEVLGIATSRMRRKLEADRRARTPPPPSCWTASSAASSTPPRPPPSCWSATPMAEARGAALAGRGDGLGRRRGGRAGRRRGRRGQGLLRRRGQPGAGLADRPPRPPPRHPRRRRAARRLRRRAASASGSPRRARSWRSAPVVDPTPAAAPRARADDLLPLRDRRGGRPRRRGRRRPEGAVTAGPPSG